MYFFVLNSSFKTRYKLSCYYSAIFVPKFFSDSRTLPSQLNSRRLLATEVRKTDTPRPPFPCSIPHLASHIQCLVPREREQGCSSPGLLRTFDPRKIWKPEAPTGYTLANVNVSSAPTFQAVFCKMSEEFLHTTDWTRLNLWCSKTARCSWRQTEVH